MEVDFDMIESAEEFVRLRRSKSPEEYRRAAEDEAPVAVWVDVVRRYPDMREWVAHNKTTPIEILEILAHDEDAAVRATVAEKRRLTSELFNLLAHDKEELVRQRLAYNKKVPLHILRYLSGDLSFVVRSVALKRLGTEVQQ